ncbi:autotransporter outer membrane beta-barrel domain-containing protein, partial [Candidatus Pelagibacter sp.]|nr:autotransporter outer membrane beta-barrel domain-containing protein [Candidatus Pelagibacter sp.]
VVGNYAFIDRANTQLAFNQIASNIGEVFQNMTAGGNFAHMMTYDCNTFGNGGCVSFGGRITNSGGNDHSGTLLLGKKFSDNFRLSGFIDQSIDHNSYTDIQVDGNVPLVGLTGVWNKDADNEGLQVKLGNTYQSNDTDITRQIIGTSESAKGDTTVETQSYIAEASYQITDATSSARPFIAVRYMETKMDGYTETGAAAPITYQDMDEDSYVAIVGVKTSKTITPDLTLNFGYGIETDLNHNDAQLQGRVVGLSAFNASAISSDPKNSKRQLVSIGADFSLAGGQIGVKGLYQELRYRKDDATTVHVSYTLPF